MAKEHIMVVEDEADILELLRNNLAREGYRVTALTSGEEGVHLARSSVPEDLGGVVRPTSCRFPPCGAAGPHLLATVPRRGGP